MHEYLLINKYIKPLVYNNKEALSLADDVAVITTTAAQNLLQIITTDCMIEGIHFFKNESPKSIAYRLIICNLSDLASKGVVPKYFTLTFCPKKIDELEEWWLEDFFNTINELQTKYSIKLIGGNTASTASKLMLSATFIGESNKLQQELPFRFKANTGDDIYVSGFLGEAYLGYCIIASENKLTDTPEWLKELNKQEINYLINKYYYPQISLELASELPEYVNACTDASDGVINSIYNICYSSKTNAKVKLSNELFSSVTQKIILHYKKSLPNLLKTLINWGGDYNLVFTVPYEKKLIFREKIINQYKSINITYLGKVIKLYDELSENFNLLDINNNILTININKYLHK